MFHFASVYVWEGQEQKAHYGGAIFHVPAARDYYNDQAYVH
jgi:hypothetical protein